MTAGRKTELQQGMAGVGVGLALVLVISGFASGGFAGGLVMIGLVILATAVAGGLTGRGPLAGGTRRTISVVAVLGVAVLAMGGALSAPPVDTDTASARTAEQAAEESAAREEAREADDRARLEAAEVSLAEAETDERANAGDGAVPGALTEDAAAQAIAGAGGTTALAALAAVEVKGRAPRTGYDRDLFGSGWVDTDRNGCDTRNDILERDLTGETFKPGTRDCVVLTGMLADPYSERSIPFRRGQDTSADVQIDHVVALSDAWQKGAQQMAEDRRRAFANDPLNLLAVDGPLNMQKGDGDAATWLPPNKSYRCAYVSRQVAVKATYGLWMTQAEKNAIATILSSCPNEPLPAGVVVTVPERQPASPPPPPPVPAPRPAPAPVPVPVPVPAPAPAPAPVPAPPPAVYYANCDAVRAAGAAPIRPGDPGWQQKFDRDRDGIGCDT
jgi:hypothetical protein